MARTIMLGCAIVIASLMLGGCDSGRSHDGRSDAELWRDVDAAADAWLSDDYAPRAKDAATDTGSQEALRATTHRP